MTVVVVTPCGRVAEALVRDLLPEPIAIVAGLRMYQFFDVLDGATEPFAFRDLDGEVIAEYRTFATMDAAKAWVTADADRERAN